MALKLSQVILILYLYVSSATWGSFYYIRLCRPPNTCTQIFQCSSLFQNFSPKSILLLNVKRSFCGFEGNTPKVCCSSPLQTTTTRPRVSRWSNELMNHKNFHLLPLDTCGVISNRFRITSGSNTRPGEFPWMALIAYKTGESLKNEDFKCGGTLINEMYVLTAAHCIDNTTMLGVRLGEHNILTEFDCDTNGQNCELLIQDLLINKTIPHPFYDPSVYTNDIALIRLAKPANYSYGNLRPICLPFGDLLHVDLEGKNLTVTGWGATENGDKSFILRKVSVPVVPSQDCQQLYQGFKPISKKQICAGADGGRDSCAGDSGGPLERVDLVRDTPRYVQYGIVSYGPTRCGINGRPGIYTNVREYMEWILDNLEPSD